MILRRGPGGYAAEERHYPDGTYNVSERNNDITGVHENSEDWEERHNDWRNTKGILTATTTVRFLFDEFGAKPSGIERYTNFAVDVQWTDVIESITRFAEHGHPEARVVQAVLDVLAQAKEHANGSDVHSA